MSFDNEEEKIKQKLLKELLSNVSKPILDRPVILTEENFNEFINTYENVVVDCWAEWCYPCRVVSPIIEELAKQYKGKIAFGKLNVDENPSIAMEYGIMGIPTILVFKNGSLVHRIVGAQPKKLIEVNILRALGVLA